MAMIKHPAGEDRKASALTDSTHTPPPAEAKKTPTRQNSRPTEDRPRPKNRRWVAILVDVLLILALVGLIVGGYFGYRAIRELYAPVWETREIVFCVRMEGIEPDMVKYGQDGRPTFTDNAIWSSGSTDADRLGTVTDVRTVLVTHADSSNSLTLYLTVTATARYREGQGYHMGNTHLLAGLEGVFRVEGMSAPGAVISLHEQADETAPATEADSQRRAPEDGESDARG